MSLSLITEEVVPHYHAGLPGQGSNPFFRISNKPQKTILFLFLAISPSISFAVAPPDFIFAIASQFWQAFSIISISLIALSGSIGYAIRHIFSNKKQALIFCSILLIIAIVIACFGASLWDQYQQKKAFEDWSFQSSLETEKLKTTQKESVTPTTTSTPPVESSRLPTIIDDQGEKVIREYYSAISSKDFQKAYGLGTKKWEYPVFLDLYETVESIVVNSVKKTGDSMYETSITIDESNILDTYDVTIKVGFDETFFFRLLETSPQKRSSSPKSLQDKEESVHAKNAPAVSNDSFKTIEKDPSSFFVLDAREDEEYTIGHYPKSTHIRMADLKAGRWEELPKDKNIYVFCWSGIRGLDVATFLESKGLHASYLQQGAKGWVDAGGQWEGSIKLSSVYTKPQYSSLLTYDQLVDAQKTGAIIIDSREKEHYSNWHIPGSLNISIVNTPSKEIGATLAQIPTNSRVITVCDQVVNCFDARIAGIKLEKLGHTFLGRYNKPWEYRDFTK